MSPKDALLQTIRWAVFYFGRHGRGKVGEAVEMMPEHISGPLKELRSKDIQEVQRGLEVEEAPKRTRAQCIQYDFDDK